jgi:serine-aspartate repeat-containing protein C/D/E
MSIRFDQFFLRFSPATLGLQSWKHSRKTQRRLASHSRRALHLDTLESRVVPAAPLVSSVLGGTAGTAVVGTVYEDLDSNGIRNNGENGISGWKVYLDLDLSGTYNQDAVGDWEPSAITNQDGDYVINHLQPGTYRVSSVVQPDWVATAPVSQDIVVTNDHESTADFFNFSGGAIVGVVWNDPEGDGVRATDPVTGAFLEPGLAGWTVYVDLDNDQTLDPSDPSTVTDAEGLYSFTNLPPGNYKVIEVLPDGWDVSSGFDVRQDVAVVARAQATLNFANFSTTNGSIQGTIWNDMNANGLRDTDAATGKFVEPGLAGWTVFLDSNGNLTLDPGEVSVTTASNGDYAFVSLPAGDYEVTEVLPSGWDVSPTFDSRQTVTVVGGKNSIADDFANFTVLNGSIRGTVWNDINRNGVRDASLAGAFTDPGLAGWTVFLDRNKNRLADPGEPTALTDASGDYVFTNLQVGDYEVREILPSGWEVTTGFGDSVGVTVYSGSESVAPDFANFNLSTAVPGSVGGFIWNDLDGDGVRDSNVGGFTDPGLAGWTVFADLNLNGVADAAEPSAVSAADGSYLLSGIAPGTVTVVELVPLGWQATAPTSAQLTFSLKNGENASGVDFGNTVLKDAAIRGTVFVDKDQNGLRGADEPGLAGITVYLDLNNNGSLDAAEPQVATSADLFFTPSINEAGTYSFTHLAPGTYTVRTILPAILSATPASELQHIVTLASSESQNGINTAAVYRPTEIHGIKFDDTDGDHVRDASEPGVGGVTIYVDLDRDNSYDAGEPTAVTAPDGSYSFVGLPPGAYVVREILETGHEATYPTTTGGILWPSGVSNPAVGNVTPTSITASLTIGESLHQSVNITLPNGGAITNLVDVFLLFDDTGSFVNNSPIVRAAFPAIISQLQTDLPGINLGFGVGRFEEYSNFAWEYSTGRPFILNQPVIAASTTGYMTAIQAALDRTTPGYGGDEPETDIEALYQLVTGLGFDGNNNGSTLDSGAAGLASTQLNPGGSGDVPSFASFQADLPNNVLPAAGSLGGAGFRAGALPVILVATDTGFAYQPKGETTITGLGGLTLPISALTGTSRPTTPSSSGAGLQQTVTALNALGGLVIGLGTNPQANVDPRQGLEALSMLTGAVNRSTTTIANGTADAIAPGDPFYFQIASGFAGSVANGVISAIQNAVTNVAVDVTVQASDPRVKIINHSGVRIGIGSGQTASFDIEFIGDGVPHRFDLQFVRNGTNVVLGSIPVVLGTPIPGDCYEFEDLSEGEIRNDVSFGSKLATAPAPTVVSIAPFSGPTTGGYDVVITGSGFVVGQTSVVFGTNPAAVVSIDSTHVTVTVPPAAGSGVVDVVVTTPAGSSTTSGTANDFTYVAPSPPTLTSFAINGGDMYAINAYGVKVAGLSGNNSIIEQLYVTFDVGVTLDAGAFSLDAGAVTVKIPGGVNPLPTGTNVVGIIAEPDVSTLDGNGGYKGYRLRFSGSAVYLNSFDYSASGNGGSGNIFTTLKDGFYKLNIAGANIHAGNSIAGTPMAGNVTQSFWTMYASFAPDDRSISPSPGDGTSVISVNSSVIDFANTNGDGHGAGNLTEYNANFDWNLDGDVGDDLIEFAKRFGAEWAF